MPLRESTGNMYGFVTHTWNPIKGLCPHGCEYCYMHRFPQKPPRLDEKELRADLGSGNTIFVGSGIDMWAEDIPSDWIHEVINHCRGYCKGNTYLFQSKNPGRFRQFFADLRGMDVVFCTTIETNRAYRQMGQTIATCHRAIDISDIPGRRMVTIEPIMDFDLPEMMCLLKIAEPEQVNIGADSKRHGLPEPSAHKVENMIERIGEFAKVHVKPNLARIVGR